MTPEHDTPRTISRRDLLIAGAAGAAAAAVGTGLPGAAKAAPGAAAGNAAAQQAATADVLVNPVQGPPPGSSFVLSQNWDFGTNGNIPDINTMSTVFQYHDQYGLYNNGNGHYGADTVAPNAATAVPGQPIEDPSNPVRAFTADSLQTYLVPLNGATTVDPPDYNCGCGSFVAQYMPPAGGALLGQHLMWETRVRYVTPPYFWFAIWCSGYLWDNGPEMDVIESFGYDNGGGNTNYHGQYWHSDSVGGVDGIGYADWAATMASLGITNYDAAQYHVWQWYYFTDDSYVVVLDGIVVQNGYLHWTEAGVEGGTSTNMTFLFDGAWGHNLVASVDHPLPASDLEGTYYEWDYSRIYLSDPSNTGWSGWGSLGGSVHDAPAVASWGPDRLDLFARDAGNNVSHQWWDGTSWSGWAESIGGPLTSAPAAISTSEGLIDVFGRGTDNALWHNAYNGSSWSGWESLGGVCTSAPAVASPGSGRIDLFVCGTGRDVSHGAIINGVWSGWTDSIGGPLTSDPAAISRANSIIDVFGRGTDNTLWHNAYDGSSWSGWQSLGGTLASAPTVASWVPGRLDVFTLGTDNGLWQTTWNAGWTGWVSQGGSGSLASAPAAISRFIGRIDVFVTATDSTVWTIVWD